MKSCDETHTSIADDHEEREQKMSTLRRIIPTPHATTGCWSNRSCWGVQENTKEENSISSDGEVLRKVRTVQNIPVFFHFL